MATRKKTTPITLEQLPEISEIVPELTSPASEPVESQGYLAKLLGISDRTVNQYISITLPRR